MKFIEKLKNRLETIDSHLCIGLDSQYDIIPSEIRKNRAIRQAIFLFNKKIVEITYKLSVAYKINLVFYEAFGIEGIEGLYLTTRYLKKHFPEIPLFADCKRAEMNNGAVMLKKQIFDWLGFDCIMITPWFGYDAVKEFINNTSYGVSVYVHDSNNSAPEFQDLRLNNGQFLYEVVAQQIVNKWNKNGNVIIEAAATYPKQLKKIREIVGDEMPILTAGIGSQGGKIQNLQGLFGSNNHRLLVSVSRGIIFAGLGKKNYFKEVLKTAEEIHNQLISVSIL